MNFMSYWHIATGFPEMIHCTRILSEQHSNTYTQSKRTLHFGGVWSIIANKPILNYVTCVYFLFPYPLKILNI
jgi:hypothetical protein